MPTVPYYLGRPAHVWIAAMSRRRPRPAAPTAGRKTQDAATARALTAASVGSWAARGCQGGTAGDMCRDVSSAGCDRRPDVLYRTS
jgi:hypothetical protein